MGLIAHSLPANTTTIQNFRPSEETHRSTNFEWTLYPPFKNCQSRSLCFALRILFLIQNAPKRGAFRTPIIYRTSRIFRAFPRRRFLVRCWSRGFSFTKHSPCLFCALVTRKETCFIGNRQNCVVCSINLASKYKLVQMKQRRIYV